VESCILAKWHKKKGDAVAPGDMLFTYETDKSTFDEEAKQGGVLLAVFAEEGDDVPCLTNVCVIGQPGEDASAFSGDAESGGNSPQPEAVMTSPVAEASHVKMEPAVATVSSAGLKASPRAKGLAARAGVDYSKATPTGPGGRIIARDIDELLKNIQPSEAEAAPEAKKQETAPASETELVKHTGIRKAIAKSMTASLQNMAQLTNNSSFDAADIMGWRAKLKQKGPDLGLPAVTVGDIVLYAVSRVLAMPAHRFLNAHYGEDGVTLFSDVNLGVAVDTDRGLMVPTLFGANHMGLAAISGGVKRLAKACREGGVSPDELTGGTFTVSNLGALGVESFTPVINPPQTAILGVCGIVERPRSADGKIELYPAMGLSLTYDHRAVDGAPAARFLADLVKYLENFTVNIAF